MKRLLSMILLALLAPSTARADTIVADPEAQQVATLGGTIVWVSGTAPGQRLMQRTPDGTVSPVEGAPEVPYYRSLDLGRDQDGKLIATYARCSTASTCKYLWDDLDGRRASFRGLVLSDCALAGAPARWRTRVVYGLECFRRVNGRKVADDARSGLYVRTKSARPVRLSTPREARRAGATSVTAVDIRGTNVAAIFADISSFAVLRGVKAGSPARTIRIGSSEGDTDQRAAGLALATTTTMFTLTDSFYGGEPARSIINRQSANCHDYQVLTATAGPGSDSAPPIGDLSAEGRSIYVVTPGAGIDRHQFKPDVGC